MILTADITTKTQRTTSTRSSLKNVVQTRDYQQSLIEQTLQIFSQELASLLIQLPTGGGKTIILSSIAKHFIHSGGKVLAIAHVDEIVQQLKEKLSSICGIPVGLIKAGYPEDRDAQVQVASIQTLHRRETWFQPALVIVDEAHHSASKTYRAVLARFPRSYILGLTATPQRLDGQGLGDIFDYMIEGPQTKQLIESGYLSPYKLYASDNPIDTKGIKKTGGDFQKRQLGKAAMLPQVMGQIIPSWQRYADGQQTIVYCCNLAHARSTKELFLSHGIPCEMISGKTPYHRRKAIIASFRNGETMVLVNVGIVTEGFDVPNVGCVQILRPTASLGLYLQMVGRSLRTSEGKDHAIILDHTYNWRSHGLPCDQRIWSLEGHATTERKRKLTVNDDGEIVEQEIVQDENAELTEIRPDLEHQDQILEQLDQLLEEADRRGFKRGWAAYRLLESPGLTYQHLRICAKRCNYHWRWADYKWADYREKWKQEAQASLGWLEGSQRQNIWWPHYLWLFQETAYDPCSEWMYVSGDSGGGGTLFDCLEYTGVELSVALFEKALTTGRIEQFDTQIACADSFDIEGGAA
ncbi:MAG: DEAD/DEAH box helicase [Cyanobacteria bacterium J06633_2]